MADVYAPRPLPTTPPLRSLTPTVLIAVALAVAAIA
jgi:hypothetical protein